MGIKVYRLGNSSEKQLTGERIDRSKPQVIRTKYIA